MFTRRENKREGGRDQGSTIKYRIKHDHHDQVHDCDGEFTAMKVKATLAKKLRAV